MSLQFITTKNSSPLVQEQQQIDGARDYSHTEQSLESDSESLSGKASMDDFFSNESLGQKRIDEQYVVMLKSDDIDSNQIKLNKPKKDQHIQQDAKKPSSSESVAAQSLVASSLSSSQPNESYNEASSLNKFASQKAVESNYQSALLSRKLQAGFNIPPISSSTLMVGRSDSFGLANAKDSMIKLRPVQFRSTKPVSTEEEENKVGSASAGAQTRPLTCHSCTVLQQEIHEARLETIFFREAYEKLAKSNKEIPTEIESLRSKCVLQAH